MPKRFVMVTSLSLSDTISSRLHRACTRLFIVAVVTLFILLQSLHSGVGQALTKTGSQSDDPFSLVEICTALGIKLVRLDGPNQGEGDQNGPTDWSSKYCPACLGTASAAILATAIAFLVFDYPERLPLVSAGEPSLVSWLYNSDINTRAPPAYLT